MRVLAIDTALEACSVAVLDTAQDAILARETRPMVRGHAEALMPFVASVMTQSFLRFSDLDRVAVTVGPGSFTGLRVGLAAARGIGLALRRPVVGLTTLAALAAPYLEEDDGPPVASAIDARHQHVYLQLFAPGALKKSIAAGLAHDLAKDVAMSRPQIVPLHEAVQATAGVVGRIVGSGARLIADAWPENMRNPLIIERRAAEIDWVARLGASVEETMATPKPLYLRAVDARPFTGQLARR